MGGVGSGRRRVVSIVSSTSASPPPEFVDQPLEPIEVVVEEPQEALVRRRRKRKPKDLEQQPVVIRKTSRPRKKPPVRVHKPRSLPDQPVVGKKPEKPQLVSTGANTNKEYCIRIVEISERTGILTDLTMLMHTFKIMFTDKILTRGG